MKALSELSIVMDPRREESRFWMIGMGLSVMIHLALLQGLVVLETGQKPLKVITWPVDPHLPRWIPPIAPPNFQGGHIRTPVVDGTPVPSQTAPIDQSIPTQGERGAQVEPVGDVPGDGGGTGEIPINIPRDPNAEPERWVPVEKYPVVIRSVVPEYPATARAFGVEGKVWVKIWVDESGRARKAVVLKSDVEVFEEPALKAAMEFLFTPAIMNNTPVSVWVSVPFVFRLKK